LLNPFDPEVELREVNNQRIINIQLSIEVIEALDQLKAQLGLRSRAAIIERLLEERFFPRKDQEVDDDLTPPSSPSPP
jgi:hypothetical protein